MNLAIAQAMLREQFQRTLPIVIFCLGLSALLGLLQYVILAWEGRVSTADGSPEMVIVTHGFAILALLYCHSDERDLKMTMPTYLLRLPVRTIDLVVWRMSYGLLCVGVIGIWSSGVHYLFFGAAVEAEFAFWTPFLIGTTTFAVLQALAWAVGANGILVLFLANPVVLLLASGSDSRSHAISSTLAATRLDPYYPRWLCLSSWHTPVCESAAERVLSSAGNLGLFGFPNDI